MARAIKQPISACRAMNALRGKRIVAPPRAQRMPISMGPTRKEAGTATRSSTRARISDAQTATAHWRAGRIDPKVHLLPSRSYHARGCEAPVNPSIRFHGRLSTTLRDSKPVLKGCAGRLDEGWVIVVTAFWGALRLGG